MWGPRFRQDSCRTHRKRPIRKGFHPYQCSMARGIRPPQSKDFSCGYEFLVAQLRARRGNPVRNTPKDQASGKQGTGISTSNELTTYESDPDGQQPFTVDTSTGLGEQHTSHKREGTMACKAKRLRSGKRTPKEARFRTHNGPRVSHHRPSQQGSTFCLCTQLRQPRGRSRNMADLQDHAQVVTPTTLPPTTGEVWNSSQENTTPWETLPITTSRHYEELTPSPGSPVWDQSLFDSHDQESRALFEAIEQLELPLFPTPRTDMATQTCEDIRWDDSRPLPSTESPFLKSILEMQPSISVEEPPESDTAHWVKPWRLQMGLLPPMFDGGKGQQPGESHHRASQPGEFLARALDKFPWEAGNTSISKRIQAIVGCLESTAATWWTESCKTTPSIAQDFQEFLSAFTTTFAPDTAPGHDVLSVENHIAAWKGESPRDLLNHVALITLKRLYDLVGHQLFAEHPQFTSTTTRGLPPPAIADLAPGASLEEVLHNLLVQSKASAKDHHVVYNILNEDRARVRRSIEQRVILLMADYMRASLQAWFPHLNQNVAREAWLTFSPTEIFEWVIYQAREGGPTQVADQSGSLQHPSITKLQAPNPSTIHLPMGDSVTTSQSHTERHRTIIANHECAFCHKLGHEEGSCVILTRYKRIRYQQSRNRCAWCSDERHRQETCAHFLAAMGPVVARGEDPRVHCHRCQSFAHSITTCTIPAMICGFCFRQGHVERECVARAEVSGHLQQELRQLPPLQRKGAWVTPPRRTNPPRSSRERARKRLQSRVDSDDDSDDHDFLIHRSRAARIKGPSNRLQPQKVPAKTRRVSQTASPNA
jgi:hypothetical protein